MPDQISVSEFIAETTEDYNSPTTSSFSTRLHSCRHTVTLLGGDHVQNEENYAQVLENLGGDFLIQDSPDFGTAFVKFSTFTKELSTLQNNLLQRLGRSIIFSLDSLLKGDLKEIK